MKRTAWIILAVILQVLCLCYMAGEREWVIHRGQTVWIRTAPVDPRDAFRGDYVRLSYSMNQVERSRRKDGLATTNLAGIVGGTRVYAALSTPTEKGLVRLETLTDRKPSSGLFLRGRTERSWGDQDLRVRYGLEAFFVEQGKGRDIESNLRRSDGIQVPLEMRVAVGNNGLGVLTGYRWSELGIGLTQDTTTNRPASIRAVTMRIVNVSTQSLAIVNQPGWTFTLENDTLRRGWGNQDWAWVGPSGSKPLLSDADVVSLAPGEETKVRIDLMDAKWFVARTNESPKNLSSLNTWAQFRIHYQAPSPEECRHLSKASHIWHGDLLSPAFGGGRID